MKHIMIRIAGSLVACACWLGAVQAEDMPSATNSIQEVTTQQQGDQTFVNLVFANPLSAVPAAWTTKEPARIVFDFAGIANRSGKAAYPVDSGSLKAIQLVQTESETRMVLSMLASTGYDTEIKGNSLLIKLAPFKQSMTARNAPVTTPTRKDDNTVTDNLATMRDLTFRRGDQGQAQILIDLSDGSVPVDIRRSSTGLTIDFQGTSIPDRLLNRRDVTDFGTPVTQIKTTGNGSQGRIEITAKGTWQHQAQLVNNQLKVEIRPLTAAEANKLVPFGQEGKKISVNFYDADLGMVLRTLAELSGRNVIVDPSLNGNKITITLDNMPYDQAIDLVLGQTNAGMRLRPGLVVFGARDVLAKRDAALADELARANETAPLVTESFQLNYVKGSDVQKLIRISVSDTSGNPTGVSTSVTPGDNGDTSKTGVQAKGLLSERGYISFDDGTNKLFIRDTQTVVDQVRDLIREVDVPPKQVLVEARIVEVSTDFTRNLGVRLNLFNSKSYNVGGNNEIGFGNLNLTGTSTTSPTLTLGNAPAFGTNYALTGSTTANLLLFNSSAGAILQMELAAAEVDNRGKTISAPRVITQNHKPAKIENLQQTTVVTGQNLATGTTIYTTYTAPLTLDVTPSITPDNRINLDLKIAKSTLTLGSLGANNLDKNTVNTSVLVDNGGTVVIGGFYRESETDNKEGVPLLSDIPYVGWLFKTTTSERSKSELLVFITPRIVNDALALR
ncbi:MAG TPA: type IV pilus secretin PilQ [Rhodocyclaceae bacterium]|nr:type IV pilus secretin PilQ [Rhodocyclaceae bacterium]